MNNEKITYTLTFDSWEQYNDFIKILKKEKMKSKKILYTFNTWEDYGDLMQYLEDRGVEWLRGGLPLTAWNRFEDLSYEIKDIVLVLKKGLLYYYIKGSVDAEILSLITYKDYEKIHWSKD